MISQTICLQEHGEFSCSSRVFGMVLLGANKPSFCGRDEGSSGQRQNHIRESVGARGRPYGFSRSDLQCSIFFITRNDGVYEFRHHDLAAAHAFCRNRFDNFMALNRGDAGYADIIIVDNSSIRHFEYEYYTRAAFVGRDELVTFVMRCDNHQEALRQNARSIHYVPDTTVLGRFDTFERDDDYDIYVNPIYEF